MGGSFAPFRVAAFTCDGRQNSVNYADVGDFPLAVHPALPGWFAELENAYTHCAWVSDWGPECIRFTQGAGLDRAAALAAPGGIPGHACGNTPDLAQAGWRPLLGGPAGPGSDSG